MKKAFIFYTVLLLTGNIHAQIKFTSVEDAVNFGISNSDSLNELKLFALTNIKMAKLSFESFLPQFETSWNEYDNIQKYSADTRTKQISFSVEQKLFDNGKSRLKYTNDKYNALISYYEMLDKFNEFRLNVLEKYYSYILQCRLIELKKALLENTEKELAVIEYKYNEGLELKSSYLEYILSCKELQKDLDDSIYEKNIILSDLKSLLNISLDAELIIEDKNENINFIQKPYAEKTEDFIALILKNNIELKKQFSSIDYISKQTKILNQFYLPAVSLKAGVSFSGIAYPLTQPDYSVNLIFSFSDIPFLPSSFSNGYRINQKKLSGLQNSTSTALNMQPGYFTSRKLSKISLAQAKTSCNETIRNLKQSVKNLIDEHDSSLKYIQLIKEAIEIREEKILISEYQVNAGLMRTSDYLKEKLELSKSRQDLVKEEISILLLQKKLEFLTEAK